MMRVAAVQSWPELKKPASLTRLGHGGQVGVVEHDHRRLAAELEMDALDGLRRGRGDLLAGGRVAGERHHVDVGMRDRGADRRLARPGHDVEHALGEDVGRQFGQRQRRERSGGRTA